MEFDISAKEVVLFCLQKHSVRKKPREKSKTNKPGQQIFSIESQVGIKEEEKIFSCLKVVCKTESGKVRDLCLFKRIKMYLTSDIIKIYNVILYIIKHIYYNSLLDKESKAKPTFLENSGKIQYACPS